MREGAITDDELAAIKQRAEKATPGPWFAHGATVSPDPASDHHGWPPDPQCLAALNDGEYVANPNAGADAEFIAAARGDVPALLAEIERLRVALRVQYEYNHSEHCTNEAHAPGDRCHWPLPVELGGDPAAYRTYEDRAHPEQQQ
jgi:hypothetical protein